MRELVIAVAVVMCVAGCTSSSDDPPKAEPTKEVVQTIDPAKATTMKLGEDLEVVAKLPQTMGDEQTYFQRFTPDGKLLGSASLPEDPSDGQMGSVTSQSHPVMYDPETKKFTVLDSRNRDEPTHLGLIVSSGDFVVWVETPESNVGVSTIAIYSYDRRSKDVTELFSSSDGDGQIVWGADLEAADGTVYFSMAGWNEEDRADSAVYAVPVDGSSPAKVLIKGGATVRVVDDLLTYTMGGGKWLSRNLKTGETEPVRVSAKAKDPGFCGAEFTMSFESLCMGKSSGESEDEVVTEAVVTVTEASGRKTVIEPFPTDLGENRPPFDIVDLAPWLGMTVTDDESTDRKYLIDLDTRTVQVFPRGTSFGALNDDKTQVLLTKRTTGKGAAQFIVRMPRAS